MWELYDELIAGIPENIVVENFNVGCNWSMVKAGGNVGIALTVKGRSRNNIYRGNIRGDALKDLASCVKSWNFIEASLGMAAINCFYNSPEKIRSLEGFHKRACAERGGDAEVKEDAFLVSSEEAAGKKVAVIGHFPNIESQLEPVCELSILERNTQPGDYPDSACEYILGEQDFVFITGMTFTNKTLPRLLELVRPGARVIMVGPSVPIAPTLFGHGITDLDGFCVTDPEKIDRLIRLGIKKDIFDGGKMVSIKKF